MEFFDTIQQVNRNWQPYKQWELEQQKKDKQNQKLKEQNPPGNNELEHAKQYGRTLVDVINTMDQHSIDKSEDASMMVKNALFAFDFVGMGLGAGIGSLCNSSPRLQKKLNLPPFAISILGASIGVSITNMIGEIWGAQVEKQASRIARYQTRKNDLNDPRAFVVYNEEQILKAKNIAKTLPDVKLEKQGISLKKSFNPITSFITAKKTTGSLAKDYKKYNEWKNEYLKQEELKADKFKDMDVPPEQLSKAQKDRDNLLNVIKKIENYSLNYFMNMKLAMIAVNIAIDVAALAVGGGVFTVIDQMQKHKILKQESTPINMAKMMFLKTFPLVVTISLIGPTIKMLKDAARIGRYKAKQELLNNPENFIVYDENQRNSVGDVSVEKPVRKSFFSQFKKDIADIKQLKNDYNDYQNYMKTIRKEELKLDEALKQVEISDNQKQDAKNLQRKAFYSFEKMDEKAQRFTDDTDAAVDVVKMLIMMCIGSAVKIFNFSFYGKKAKLYNNGKQLEFTDMFKMLKHFRAKDILTIVGVSFIPILVKIPLIVKGIHIKKEAGKIGVMTAMQDLDDPKNFLDDNGCS